MSFQGRWTLYASLLVLTACGGGGGEGGDPFPVENSALPAAKSTIGPEGGTVDINDPSSPIHFTKIIIPAGALKDSTEITIAEASLPGSMPGSSHSASEVPIELGPVGLTFLKPVSITLKYADSKNDGLVDGTSFSEEEVAALYTSGQNGEWQIFNPLERDPEANTITFQTTHFSTYLSYVGDATSENAHYANTPAFYLTVLRPNGLLAAWGDSKPNLSGPGVPCSIAEDYLSCTVDAAALFPEIIGASGDPALWDWQCEYVPEHTVLRNYEGLDDALRPENEGTGIYCEMEAVDADPAAVRVNWGIHVDEEIYYVDHDRLIIRFWANQIAPATE
jgi:hypothetical protein